MVVIKVGLLSFTNLTLICSFQQIVLSYTPLTNQRVQFFAKEERNGLVYRSSQNNNRNPFTLLFLAPDDYKIPAETKPYTTWIDPDTNCQVIVLGCLHGSPSSTADLENILQRTRPAAIVLELCASRYQILQKLMQVKQNEGELKRTKTLFYSPSKVGMSSGIASIILGFASGLQTKFSGFEPGLEFKSAIEYSNRTKCDIILADQVISETLRRIGDLPQVCLNFLLCLFRNLDPIQTEFSNFKTALWGDDNLWKSGSSTQIDVGKVLFRDTRVIGDLLRLTLPSLIITSVSFHFGFVAIDMLFSPQSAISSTTTLLTTADSFVPAPSSEIFNIITNTMALWGTFIFLALPLSKVILTERDSYLAQGVKNAIEIVSNKKTVPLKENLPTIVVVLGLLHVNGVTKLLLNSDSTMESAK